MEAPPRSVLLVDDDMRSVRMLARMLRDDGFCVELAFDGASAISRLTREPTVALLITDLRLPYADGMAVAEFARSRNASLPVLFITSYPELLPEHAIQPAPQVLTKPIDYEALRAQVHGSLAAESDSVRHQCGTRNAE